MSDRIGAVNEQKVISDQSSSGTLSRIEEEQHQVAHDLHQATKDQTLKVRVSSPFKDYYENYVFSLTAESATGPFDILPGHHNFISLLVPCELIIRTLETDELRIRISGGIIHAKADEIIVFLDV